MRVVRVAAFLAHGSCSYSVRDAILKSVRSLAYPRKGVAVRCVSQRALPCPALVLEAVQYALVQLLLLWALAAAVPMQAPRRPLRALRRACVAVGAWLMRKEVRRFRRG